MSEFEDRINSVLNDPEQMDKIANLAKSLMGGGDGQSADAGDGGMMGKLGELAKPVRGRCQCLPGAFCPAGAAAGNAP